MNKAILHGNVGKDPVVRAISGDKKTASFSLATSRNSKDRDGNKTTVTSWHNIVLWDKLAELAERFVKKGSSLIIEGEIQYRTYQDKDNNTKYITEIVGREMHFTGKKPDSGTALDAASETAQYRDELTNPQIDDSPF